jgi:NADPH2:quinone reductase
MIKAVVAHSFGGTEVMHLEDVPDLTPGRDQVLVRLQAAGVNPVDTYIRAGAYGKLPELPYTPGFDGAGVVEACGTEVRGLRRGASVFVSGSLSGTYAEACLCLPSQVHPLPPGASPEMGACLGIPYGTAGYALFHRAKVRRGQTVLIHGATGGVGTAALQLAKRAGLKILATYGSESGRKLLIELGADAVFDHHQTGYESGILEFTKGTGVDVILELAAHLNLGRDLALLAAGGVVCVIGSRGLVQIQPRELMVRDADIRGVLWFNAPKGVVGKVFGDFYSGLADGSIRPVIRRSFPLEKASEAHEVQMTRGALGNIVLVP